MNIVRHRHQDNKRPEQIESGLRAGLGLSRYAACVGGGDQAIGEYEDLVKAGVVDPTKVTRTALQNAASISALVLTTEALVTELPEKEKPAPDGPGGMGGMDY